MGKLDVSNISVLHTSVRRGDVVWRYLVTVGEKQAGCGHGDQQQKLVATLSQVHRLTEYNETAQSDIEQLEYGRFADTDNCIKTAFHDTDILEDREDVGEDVGVVECGLYAIVCVGETSDIVGVTSVGETSCRRNVRTTSSFTRASTNLVTHAGGG